VKTKMYYDYGEWLGLSVGLVLTSSSWASPKLNYIPSIICLVAMYSESDPDQLSSDFTSLFVLRPHSLLYMQDRSPSSSSTSPPSFVLQKRDVRKCSTEQVLLDPSLPSSAPSGASTSTIHEQRPPSLTRRIFANTSRNVALRFPKTYRWTKRVVLYVRGPQPSEELSRECPRSFKMFWA
jgi:hypothetical protein